MSGRNYAVLTVPVSSGIPKILSSSSYSLDKSSWASHDSNRTCKRYAPVHQWPHYVSCLGC